MYPRLTRAVDQRGALMIEVLVAMLLLSLGLLAMAGLQRASMQAFGNSRRRMEASMVAHDLAERIRAHPAEASSGAYDDDRRPAGSEAVEVHLERGIDRKHPWLIQLAWDEPAAFADDPQSPTACAATKSSRTHGANPNPAAIAHSCMTLEFMP